MIGLLQRVSQARVTIDDSPVAAIGCGLLVLVGVERGDTATQATRLAERICGYRVFPDASGKMNLSVREQGGEVLLVPQFTLAANTEKGMRASFARAAEPVAGERLFEALVAAVRALHGSARTGAFGAQMQVALVNDGPVTFWLRAAPPA
ncbi:MAG: D-aminoacyl-tRNA deacylase [Gammaproteobacteria bacterium]|nr:D-aminoacyl-tRNA deacylase [Gammaproteobacteria bacterium]